ncbi:MAG: hypothetical protein GKC04_08625, partial [Methanomicrobiales archaeon]|nr:hypothetical protein [Methanomicrobiales archaeon]
MIPDCIILTAACHIDNTAAFLEKLRDIGERNGTEIICFDADRMAGHGHVRAALM